MPAATRIVDKASGAYVGKYTGTTAAQNIHIGFKPGFIQAWNRTDGDTFWQWTKDDVANVMTIVAATASAAIAITQVDDGTSIGFALPSNAVVNEDADVYVFIAYPE